MADKLKITLDNVGIKLLLKDATIAAQCKSQAEAVARRAGSGYEVEEHRYPERIGYSISPVTAEARKDTYENNTLVKALGL